MKLFINIFYFLLTLFAGGVDITEEVSAAIKQGRASELAKYFDEKVSFKNVNQEDVVSKSQAEANLRYFFEKHPVKNFSSVHVSIINNNSQYLVGTLETANGKYRVSVLIRRNLISQFRIEADNE